MIPLSLLQLEAGQLGWTVTAGGIHIQQLHAPLHTDDTFLGELQVPSYIAIQAVQEPLFQITGAGRLGDSRHGPD